MSVIDFGFDLDEVSAEIPASRVGPVRRGCVIELANSSIRRCKVPLYLWL